MRSNRKWNKQHAHIKCRVCHLNSPDARVFWLGYGYCCLSCYKTNITNAHKNTFQELGEIENGK